MTKFFVSISNVNKEQSLINTIGGIKLSKKTIEKYFSFDEDGEISYDTEELENALYRYPYNDDTDNFPTITSLSDSYHTIGRGPEITNKSQIISVCNQDNTEIWSKDIQELFYLDIDVNRNENDAKLSIDFFPPITDSIEDVWIYYNKFRRARYSAYFEAETFDPSKLSILTENLFDNWNLVTGIGYDDKRIEHEIYDVIGQGISIYLYRNGHSELFG